MDTSKYHDKTALRFFLMIPLVQLLIWGASFYLGDFVWDDAPSGDTAAETAPDTEEPPEDPPAPE